jgi:hypothetical protein
MSLEDLDRIMLTDEDPVAKAKAEAEEKAAEAEEDDTVDPNPDDEPADEDPAEEDDADDDPAESDDDDTKEADEADEKKEQDEEAPLERRIRLLERRLELEALERTKETEARKRAELLASKQAGRAGYLQRQLQQSPPKAQPAKAEADGDEDPWDEKEEQSQDNRQEQNLPAQQEQLVDEDRIELARMAIHDEGNEFAKRHAQELEEMPEEFLNRMQELMQEEAAPYVEEFSTSSMKVVRKLARSLMNSAYATARIEFADKVAENATKEATTRKAASVEKSKRRKAKAAISKGGVKKKAQPKTKSYEDMTLEELEAEMAKEHGDNYRAGSDMSKHGGL